MKLSWTVIVGIVLAIWRWLVPQNKWETKRESARKVLKEIDRELEEVTLAIVEAKKNGNALASASLDMERQRLLANRRECQREYEYFCGLCDKSR